MLFPVSTDQPVRRPPLVTYALIAINAAVFVVQTVLKSAQPAQYERFMAAGAVWGRHFEWHTLLTSVFMHGSFAHIAGNMLILWTFGPNIEDRFGKVRFLLFYLVGGAAASGLHAVFSPNPALGASGAIASVTGAFLVMYPFVGVKCFNLLYMALMWLPAWWLVGFALVWDLIMQGSGARTGTAHLAHLGGYAWGIGLSASLIGLKLMQRRPYDLFTWGRQVHRRRQIKSAVGQAQAEQARRFEQVARDPQLAKQTELLAKARAEVTAHLSGGETEQARRAYRELADRYDHLPGATLLPRRQQFEIAALFQQAGDAEGAAHAIGRFLEGYPRDPDAPQLRLLLGLVHARSLNDPLKAKALIREAIAGGLDESTRQMAQRELEALG